MDLRRRALAGGKTVSRKRAANEYFQGAGAVPISTPSSQASSRNSSRNPSRAPSEDEDTGNYSDDAGLSVGSLDELTDADADYDTWTTELSNVITNIVDRKRSSHQGREQTCTAFSRLSKFHPMQDELYGHVEELIGAFSKSIKSGDDEPEINAALRALELLSVNAYDNTIFERVDSLLSSTIRDSTSNIVKSNAIHCLGACTLFGGGGEDSISDLMNFFLDIISSDGQSIDATDDPKSVTAALQEWGHLATQITDLSAESEESVQVFLDQLDSSDTGVQIAAGENIALLYEKTYRPHSYYDDNDDENDNEDNEDNVENDDEEQLSYSGPKLVKRYDAYHNTQEVTEKLHELSVAHSKRISKRDKKTLHSNFTSILTTVEDPRRGYMYSTTIDEETGRHQGSKFSFKVGRDGAMQIDRWWKWIRFNSFRRLLQGGFSAQYSYGNRAMVENLPGVERWVDGDDESEQWTSSKSKGKKGKKGRRNDTKFAVHHMDD